MKRLTKKLFLKGSDAKVEWSYSGELPSDVTERLERLRDNSSNFTITYDYPSAPRTTHLVDRLMKRMDRHLFNRQYFHGSQESAELSIQSGALIENFAPSNPHTIKKHKGWQSPAERLNKFRYHKSWLQNLLISDQTFQYF